MAMTIQQVRDYWDRRPCNIRHSPIDIDKAPLAYSMTVTWRKRIVEPHIRPFLEPWRWANMKVLDLGCGIGTDTLELAKCGAHVTAMDISQESCKIAAKRVLAEGYNGRVAWIIGDIEELWHEPTMLADRAVRSLLGTYDLVWSFGVIHHTPNPERVIRNVRQWIAPSGLFRLMLYHRKSTKVARILIRHLPLLLSSRKTIDQIVAMESEAQTGCPITYTYTKDSARKLLEDNGFKVRSMRVEHIFPWSVKHYTQFRYIRAFPWNIIPRPIFRWLERHVGWHLLIEAVPK